ncbi:hypothetical protein AKI39_15880 [Bordetella sp. H567]|nr:hypothetical protein AKI39_15880 [Bordetella sp. H567]
MTGAVPEGWLAYGAGAGVPGGTLSFLGGVAVESLGVVEGVVGAFCCANAAPDPQAAARINMEVRRLIFILLSFRVANWDFLSSKPYACPCPMLRSAWSGTGLARQ